MSTGTARVLDEAVDLERFVPEAVLEETRGRDLRMHRRSHRLAGPVVVYLGRFTREGSLAAAVDAAVELSADFPEVRLAALCDGRLDRRYLGRCERAAMELGHRCIVVRRPSDDELPLWFGAAVAAVADGNQLRPALLAAAAGVPLVSSSQAAAGYPSVMPEGGYAAALARLLRDDEKRRALGIEARRWAEAHLDEAGSGKLGEHAEQLPQDGLPAVVRNSGGR